MTKIFRLATVLGLSQADVLLQRSWKSLDPAEKKLANNIWSPGDNSGNPPDHTVAFFDEFSDDKQSFHVSFDITLRENYESALWRSLFTAGSLYDVSDENYQYPRLGKLCAVPKGTCEGCQTGIYYGRKGQYHYIDMRDAAADNLFDCSNDNPLITYDPIPTQHKQCVCAGKEYTESTMDRVSLYFSPNGKWADRSKDWDLALLQGCQYLAPWNSTVISNYSTGWKTGENHHIEIFYDSSNDGRVRVYLDGHLAINEERIYCEHKSDRRQIWKGTPWVNGWREGLAGVDLGNFMFNDEGTSEYERGCLAKKRLTTIDFAGTIAETEGQEEIESIDADYGFLSFFRK